MKFDIDDEDLNRKIAYIARQRGITVKQLILALLKDEIDECEKLGYFHGF
ncbi:MAG: hypothetical protein ACFFD4_02355 [Candidatus Odinarchaeota archaeon]